MRVCLLNGGDCLFEICDKPGQVVGKLRHSRVRVHENHELSLRKRRSRQKTTSALLKTNVICLVSCMLIILIHNNNLQFSSLFLVSAQTTTSSVNPISDHHAPAQHPITSNNQSNSNSPSKTQAAILTNAIFVATSISSTSGELRLVDPNAIETRSNNNNNNLQRKDIPSTPTIESDKSSNANDSISGKSVKQRRATSSSDFKHLHAEAEILPFGDFNLQQPAFSDLIKIWPPTTQHQLLQIQQKKQEQQTSKRKQSQHQQQEAQQQDQHWWSFGANSGGLQDNSLLSRNNLNEDLDDMIVTADQSFEQEQSSEPAPVVNYLGDFIGDFLYDRLRKLFERQLDWSSSSLPSPASSINQTQAASSNPVGNLRASLEELLDDYYYQQYENSQVLYYGTQLAREGDTVEIGCFMPLEQTSEWTKSALPIVQQDSSSSQSSQRDVIIEPGSSGLPRVIKRTEFLGAKLNFSLKIFEAQVSDSGNYRCNRMSRKYHKLLIVPQKIKQDQLYTIQQRLLSIVNPKVLIESNQQQQPQDSSNMQARTRGPVFASLYPPPHILRAVCSAETRASQAQISQQPSRQQMQRPNSRQKWLSSSQQQVASVNNIFRQTNLPSSVLIVEHEQVLISCNITDELILRKMRDNELFSVDWYKNNKLLRLPSQRATQSQQQQQQNQHGQSVASPVDESLGPQQKRAQSQQAKRRQPSQQLHSQQQNQEPAKQATLAQAVISSERIRTLWPNGRQLLISPAYYSDAGDYRCSWARLTNRQRNNNNEQINNNYGKATAVEGQDDLETQADQSAAANAVSAQMLAPSSLTQLVTPTRLRPFARSVFHAREGSELRLACLAQGGYPSPIIEWYIGNRLVDEDYLRLSDARILQLKSTSVTQLVALGVANKTSSSSSSRSPKLHIVEINPIPERSNNLQARAGGSLRHQQHSSQMQQQSPPNWIDYRDASDERLALESGEQQLRYAQFKMAQLLSLGSPTPLVPNNPAIGEQLASSLQQAAAASSSSSSQQPNLLSILVVGSLELERHSARFACRAVTRVNTDEVTTVVKVLSK